MSESMDNTLLKNPHLKSLENDRLFHIGLDANSDLKSTFGDVKFVCMGGSTDRMKKFAEFIQNELKDYLEDKDQKKPCNLSTSDRYVLYKVGPVLSANHGIGVPSLMVILHEIMKLLHYAEAKDVKFIRIGTSGGLGLAPGTVVITKTAVNPFFQPYSEQIILGKAVTFPASLNENLREELIKCAGDIPTTVGSTMCTNDFYEGQGRLDGAFCDYTLEDKLQYLQEAYKNGVRNIEMECINFAAMCNRAQIPAAVICVTLLDRLKGDQVVLTHEQHSDFQLRPQKIVAAYIKENWHCHEGNGVNYAQEPRK